MMALTLRNLEKGGGDMGRRERQAVIRAVEAEAGRPLSIPEQRQAELALLWAGLQAHLHVAGLEYLRGLPARDRSRLRPLLPLKP